MQWNQFNSIRQDFDGKVKTVSDCKREQVLNSNTEETSTSCSWVGMQYPQVGQTRPFRGFKVHIRGKVAPPSFDFSSPLPLEVLS